MKADRSRRRQCWASEAGADLNAKDTAWNGTPLGWALHYVTETTGENAGKQYDGIAAYLRVRSGS